MVTPKKGRKDNIVNIFLYSKNNTLLSKQSNILINFKNKYNFLRVYENFKDDRFNIVKDHKKNKVGIYLLFNKINNHFYIGSSINIRGRMKNYWNKSNLKSKKNKNMAISRALLKYGHNNFALIIIEYLELKDLILRETY